MPVAVDMNAPPWPAPGKLNLMLRVLGRRADGYHRLQTVFQFIGLQDLIYLTPNDHGGIVRHSELTGVPPENDLVVRAARLLKEHTGCSAGVDIAVDKRLPMGGGLGGGSSDCATTLVGLNRLWGTGLGEDELMSLGLSLGADVPVFVRGLAAWGEGVGEELTPIQIDEPWYVVLVPDCFVSTRDVFCAEGLTRDSPPITIADFLAGDAINDCLPVVREHYQPVAEALDWLARFAPSRLTGTGACVFAAFSTEEDARAVIGQARGLRAFVARGMNRSPLRERLASH